MESDKIVRFCAENDLLLDNNALNFFLLIDSEYIVFNIISKFKNDFDKKFITRKVIFENKKYFKDIILDLDIEESKKINYFNKLENYFNKLDNRNKNVLVEDYDIISKKINLGDFVEHFRFRFNEMKNYLINRKGFDNIISINKISNIKSKNSIIGIVFDKKITKNGNILLEVEDLTGRIKVLLNKDRFLDIFDDICLDSVIGINGVGNKEIIFIDDIFFCDSKIEIIKKSNINESVAFIGDIHIGSIYFLEEGFVNFINFLNSGKDEALNIKYLFIIGDLISGVGVYPGQENELKIKKIKDQYAKFYEFIKKIRKDIEIIIISGNHDGVRLAEPQPKINKKYAENIYSMKNVFICNNPTNFIIGKNKDFSGFKILAYHGFSYMYYLNNVSKFILNKFINSPEKLMSYFLKNRHLAPDYSSTYSFPVNNELIIKDVPDIFISGHLHKSGFDYYNNILMISCSSWETQTPYQKKAGIVPDFCKVPIFNLKTREIKVMDFNKKVENKNGN